MNREQEFDFIERFFEGQLNAKELEEFERIKAEDLGFALRVTQYREIIDGIQTYHQQDFMQKLEAWENESSEAKTFKINPVYLKAAAAIILLIIPLGIWLATLSPSYHSLYDQYYQPYPDVVSSRSQDNQLQEAMKAYNEKNYNQAILFLQKQLNQEEEPMVKLYLAEAYLATNQWQQARDLFLQLKNGSNYGDLSGWRLALINLQLENIDQAKKQLQAISRDTLHDYHQEAGALFEKIN